MALLRLFLGCIKAQLNINLDSAPAVDIGVALKARPSLVSCLKLVVVYEDDWVPQVAPRLHYTAPFKAFLRRYYGAFKALLWRF